MPVVGNKSVVVTLSDSADNPAGPFFINVDTTGLYKITLAMDATGTYSNLYLAAGVVHPILVKRAWATQPGTVYGVESIMGPY